jgi:hypothetical protein
MFTLAIIRQVETRKIKDHNTSTREKMQSLAIERLFQHLHSHGNKNLPKLRFPLILQTKPKIKQNIVVLYIFSLFIRGFHVYDDVAIRQSVLTSHLEG